MNKLLFIFVLLPALAFADMSWKQCGSKAPVPVNVTSEFCSATPCQFKQGENIGFTMNFIPGLLKLFYTMLLSSVIY